MSARQMPDRSGLPSAARGIAAARFGFPSGVRGVPGSGSDSHCATAVVDVTRRTIAHSANSRNRFIASLLHALAVLNCLAVYARRFPGCCLPTLRDDTTRIDRL